MHPRVIGSALLTLLVCGLAACQTTRPPETGLGDPDRRATELAQAWLSAPSNALYASAPQGRGGETRSRAFIRRQVQNLVFRHPDHVPARMLAAVTAYESRDPIDATRHLDYLLRLQPSHPEAAMLRARIALEQGNSAYAVRLLGDQVHMRPDHAGLRELLASALYMSGEAEQAMAALDAAAKLGASPARIAYNRGLVAEGQGNVEEARRHYGEALEHEPSWSRPQERLTGLDNAAPRAPLADQSFPPLEPPPAPALPATYLR